MSLAAQLANTFEAFQKNAPDAAKNPIIAAKDKHVRTFDTSKAIQPGEKLPEFALPDATGKEVSSKKLLSQGPLLITFYRGEWCPFCNLAISAFQKHLPEIKAKGVNLVAISPELPNQSLTTMEKYNLEFSVLSDESNKLAKQLGLLFAMPDTLKPVFEMFGTDLKKRNGDDSFEVPVPATMLVDQHGIVRNTWVDPDYTKRCDPKTTLEWIGAMKA
ncbi:MAG: hypothetical protein LQ340_000596 [Diploschistes diacapsis]|nr:MAG: hypothetical protein LQ340_000596 [Diploschistes diacapsis]